MKWVFISLFCFAPVQGARTKDGANGHILVRIAPGFYQLGDPDHKLNKSHKFKTAGFSISDAETTNAQFAAFVADTGYRTFAEKN
ncbi:MAG: SUMF1/EgtB/PvdO family nonheme iron enzyme, partial [Luteolibacter sp.]